MYLLDDATSDEALLNAGVEKAAAVLALLPSDADNLYVTVTAKALNPSCASLRGRSTSAVS